MSAPGKLVLALPKGRVKDESLAAFRAAGMTLADTGGSERLPLITIPAQ